MRESYKVASEIPPSQFEEFLRSSPYRKSDYALIVLFKRPEFTAEMLHGIVMQTPLSELQKKWDRKPGGGIPVHPPIFSSGLSKESTLIPMKMRRVADHPNVDVQTLVYLAENSNSFVQGAVASNPKTPVEILRKLGQQKNEWIDPALARNPSTPTDMLDDLVKVYRWGVAENPNASKETLKKLAQDSDDQVRFYVAKNPSLAKEDLEMLAQDPDGFVRLGVLRNPNCPEEIKERLRNDPDEKVQWYFEED